MIVIDEYNYVKKILEEHIIPKNMSIKKIMLYIAKYYYSDNLSLNEYIRMIYDKILDFNLPQIYQAYKYEDYLKTICKKILNGEIPTSLRKIDSISLFKSEYENISRCISDRQRKLLFTLYILAKINNCNGWVNYESKDIFTLANITTTTKERSLLIYEMYQQGLLEQTHKNDVIGYKVELGNDTEEIILTINSFENLGNQFLAFYKDNWKMCELCGRMIKKKAPNIKYCKPCSQQKNLEKYSHYNEKR